METQATKRRKVEIAPQSKDSFSGAAAIKRFFQLDLEADKEVQQCLIQLRTYFNSISAQDVEEQDSSTFQQLMLEHLPVEPRSRQADGTEGKIEGHSNHTVNSPLVSRLLEILHHSVDQGREARYSSVVESLAALLQSLSTFLELKDAGNAIICVLLDEPNLKLLARGLSANKEKIHLIEPVLRLLTQAIEFDGGTNAPLIMKSRETCFMRLHVFLNPRAQKDDHEQHPRKKRTSSRQLALRFVVSNLRLQSSTGRATLLMDERILQAMLHDCSDDDPTILLDLLNVFRQISRQNGTSGQSLRNRLFRPRLLTQLANILDYGGTGKSKGIAEGTIAKVHDAAQALLREICQQDLNPAHVDTFSQFSTKDNPALTKREEDIITFLTSLRPHATLAHLQLTLACFQASPFMLSGRYFSERMFAFHPALSVTWLGYAHFLLSLIHLPVPDLRHLRTQKLSRSVKLLSELVLPQPLTQKIVTRCLNQASPLVTFITLRLLNAALEKLEGIKRLLRQQYALDHRDTQSSNALCQGLEKEIINRLPTIDHVISHIGKSYNHIPSFFEAAMRLIRNYHLIVPSLALGKTHNIAKPLLASWHKVFDTTDPIECDSLKPLLRQHLVQIANLSPDFDWLQKPSNGLYCPLVHVLQDHLRLVRQRNSAAGSSRILLRLFQEHYIFLASDHNTPLQVLSASLMQDDQNLTCVLAYLSACMIRLSKKPVEYWEIQQKLPDRSKSGNLLLVVAIEQFSHLSKRKDDSASTAVLAWLSRYVNMLVHEGLSAVDARSLIETYEESAEDMKEVLLSAINRPISSSDRKSLQDAISAERISQGSPPYQGGQETSGVDELAHSSNYPLEMPEDSEDRPELMRWSTMPLIDSMTDGHVGNLIMCLTSQHEGIRKEALMHLRKTKHMVSDLPQLSCRLLVQELLETIDSEKLDRVSGFAASLAEAMIPITLAPTHLLFGKANKFLLRSPRWNIAKLPSYWVDKILLEEPSKDNAQNEEIEWLLHTLFNGLRCQEDLATYINCNILERLLAAALTPQLFNDTCLDKTLRLLDRCIGIGGLGIDRLRSSLTAWTMQARAVMSPEHLPRLNAVCKHLDSS